MTTATDWDVRDTETNDQLTVTDVQARIDRLDGAATEAPVQIEPWVPRDPHAGERCRCGEYHESALIAPTSEILAVEGSTVAAEMVSGIDRTPGWPTWLGAVHHADATWTQAVTDLRSWADSYTARPIERTIVEPVEEDTSWRTSDAALYADTIVSLAKLTAPTDTVGGQVYDEERGWVEIDAPPDNRVQRMVEDPERYFAEARERAERQVQAESGADLVAGPPADRSGLDKLKERVPTALTTGEQPALEPEPDEAAVEALKRALRAVDRSGLQSDDEWIERRAVELIRDHGVRVEVPNA